MTPILYEETETNFETNGIGRLADAITCTVTEARNGEYYLDMTYPISGKHYEDIQNGRMILARPEPGKELQPFEIKHISRPMNGIISIEAVHISYRLSNIPVLPFTAKSASEALDGLVTNSAEPNPFTVWTDKAVAADYKLDKPQSFRACLGGTEESLLDTYGTAEYEFDRFTVKMHLHRGTDRGVVIRYGKNLTDIKQEESIENTITGICPYWSGTVNGETVTVTLPEKVIQSDAAEKYAYHRTVTVDLSQEIKLPEGTDQPTVDMLRAAAKQYMAEHDFGVPEVNLTVSYVDLADTVEYRDKQTEQINLCDTVTVIFDRLGVNATAKVISVEYDVLAERYNKIELGSYRSTLADTIYKNSQYKTDLANSIAASELEQQKARGMEISKALQESKVNAGRQIKDLKNLEGYAFVHYNTNGQTYEFIVADSDNLEKAVNVWRWNQGGLAHSSTGYNGDYSHVAITQDGAIVADAITSGIMNAGVIRAGILQDAKGTNYWNLETGEFKLQALSGYSTKDDTSSALATAKSYADTASDNALAEAKGYADASSAGAVSGQTQEDIFNKLTNNGETQGIYLQDSKLYINGEYIKSGSISADQINGGTITSSAFLSSNKRSDESFYRQLEIDRATLGLSSNSSKLSDTLYNTSTVPRVRLGNSTTNNGFLDLFSGDSKVVKENDTDTYYGECGDNGNMLHLVPSSQRFYHNGSEAGGLSISADGSYIGLFGGNNTNLYDFLIRKNTTSGRDQAEIYDTKSVRFSIDGNFCGCIDAGGSNSAPTLSLLADQGDTLQIGHITNRTLDSNERMTGSYTYYGNIKIDTSGVMHIYDTVKYGDSITLAGAWTYTDSSGTKLQYFAWS